MKEPIRDPKVMSRMKMAFDLYETAEAIMRQNLRRRFPDAQEAEIERLLVSWLRRRPGAEHGDGPGRPSRRLERSE
ncbi:MAG TPA: hypothetical protein VN493_18145 [Thermoanaerobaculia bacterium]|nr:hypothetical protein [Thermoanaerobaculia bacterium]